MHFESKQKLCSEENLRRATFKLILAAGSDKQALEWIVTEENFV